MPETFRTTISAVFWTETTDDSDSVVADVTAQLPEQDRDATLVTVEYKPEGRPVADEPAEAEA